MSKIDNSSFEAHKEATADIRRPIPFFNMIEPWRFCGEMASLGWAWPFLATAPRGDGHPVMVLPGFATSDSTTVILRQFLRLMGYDVHPLDLGWNFDQHTVGENGEHVAERIAAVRAATGRKLSLVGWSLGGVIAREAVRRDPDDLRQVVTLASPFTGNPHATNLSRAYKIMTGNKFSSDRSKARYMEGAQALPIPTTSLYSRTDGITAWQNCIGETDDINENVEVVSSHFGFVANPAALYVIAERLAQPEGEWQKFEPKGPFRSFYG